MTAKIYVTLKTAVLDPQGQAVQRSLLRLGFAEARDVRVGKYVEVKLEGKTAAEAAVRVEAMCKDLLANTVIEDYRYELCD